MLHSAAGKASSSVGFYGWSPDFLLPVRNKSQLNSAFDAISELVAALGSADVTPVAAFVSVMGNLSTLRKCSPEEQAEKEDDGQTVNPRLVNSGAMFAQKSFRCMATSKQATAAKRRFEPIQTAT